MSQSQLDDFHNWGSFVWGNDEFNFSTVRDLNVSDVRLDPVKFGIIGCANIARKNVRAMTLSPFCKCVGVASRSIIKCKEWIKLNIDVGSIDSVKAYGSYSELLADPEIEVVYMPLPTTHHLQWIKEAAKAKKHILIEKPVAINAEQILDMHRIVDTEGVLLMDGVMFMHNQRLFNVMKLFQPYPLSLHGNIKRINSTFSFQGDFFFQSENIRVKKDGDPLGCLGDLGWYNIRFALCCFNLEPPVAVKCNNLIYNADGVPIEADAFVYWGSPETHDKVLSFHCSFNHMFRQDVEVVTDNHTRLLMDDFVIANEPVNEYKLQFCPGLRNLDTLAIRETKLVSSISSEPQEVKMFNNFSLLVKLLNQFDSEHKGTFLSSANKKFMRMCYFSHSIIDKVLESNQQGNSLIYFTEQDLIHYISEM